ncbi:putative HIV-1 rev-binding protein [Histomonas meleagridis]|uniref:putative HIV-1 rev-binding protein n=1 Tax=Histomonas meleagridis TaxID=135588 RepID=UPI00355AA03A|nr:putative HIV-1 rev-binding protein [Histomonas meleagridis]KAH0803941.1 putative HIV-1 rev-binding protein [Histomonas meleagridis]
MKHPLLEESSFAVLFPHYRERYLTDIWPKVEEKLKTLGIDCTLDTKDGVMVVRTTNETWDPCAIIRCRDLIKLLARSVPFENAVRVLDDDVESMIIVIGRDIRNTERFIKRRQRLIGPNGDTLKALELLTKCYILVQGHTVAAIGPPEGLRTVQKVATDCMNNIHPVYHIKTLMVKRDLMKRPELANQDWDRFLPKFKKMNKKKKKFKRKIRNKNILPDYPKDTEIDRQIESGEYFLKHKTGEKRRKQKELNKKTVDGALQTVEEIQTVTEADLQKSNVPSTEQIVASLKAKQEQK